MKTFKKLILEAYSSRSVLCWDNSTEKYFLSRLNPDNWVKDTSNLFGKRFEKVIDFR